MTNFLSWIWSKTVTFGLVWIRYGLKYAKRGCKIASFWKFKKWETLGVSKYLSLKISLQAMQATTARVAMSEKRLSAQWTQTHFRGSRCYTVRRSLWLSKWLQQLLMLVPTEKPLGRGQGHKHAPIQIWGHVMKLYILLTVVIFSFKKLILTL